MIGHWYTLLLQSSAQAAVYREVIALASAITTSRLMSSPFDTATALASPFATTVALASAIDLEEV